MARLIVENVLVIVPEHSLFADIRELEDGTRYAVRDGIGYKLYPGTNTIEISGHNGPVLQGVSLEEENSGI